MRLHAIFTLGPGRPQIKRQKTPLRYGNSPYVRFCGDHATTAASVTHTCPVTPDAGVARVTSRPASASQRRGQRTDVVERIEALQQPERNLDPTVAQHRNRAIAELRGQLGIAQ